MNSYSLEGVLFRPVYFTPSFSKHQGHLCGGIQVHITERDSIRAFEMGIRLIYVLMDLYKDKFEFLPPGQEGIHPFFDHLAGTDEIRLRSKPYEELIDGFGSECILRIEGKISPVRLKSPPHRT